MRALNYDQFKPSDPPMEDSVKDSYGIDPAMQLPKPRTAATITTHLFNHHGGKVPVNVSMEKLQELHDAHHRHDKSSRHTHRGM